MSINYATKYEAALDGIIRQSSPTGVLEFKSGGISMNLAEIKNAALTELTGATTDQNGAVVYAPDDNAPYFALGFRAAKALGFNKYYWLYKVKFSMGNQDFQTKGDGISIQTPTLDGVFAAADFKDGRGKHPWKIELDETAAAVAAVNDTDVLNRDRTVRITIGEKPYGITLTLAALYKISRRFGSLNGVLTANINFGDLIFYVTALANDEEITEEFVKANASVLEFAKFPDLITECVNAGLRRDITSRAPVSSVNKSNDTEMFLQIIYCGTVHLNRTEREILAVPAGYPLDLLELHKQYLGGSVKKDDNTIKFIDEIDF